MRCPSCQRYFCRECAVEHQGRLLCAECLAKIAASSAGAKGHSRLKAVFAGAALIAAALGGFLFAWMVFYYIGSALARAPFDFHSGG